jgi:hypothetical protein
VVDADAIGPAAADFTLGMDIDLGHLGTDSERRRAENKTGENDGETMRRHLDAVAFDLNSIPLERQKAR